MVGWKVKVGRHTLAKGGKTRGGKCRKEYVVWEEEDKFAKHKEKDRWGGPGRISWPCSRRRMGGGVNV